VTAVDTGDHRLLKPGPRSGVKKPCGHDSKRLKDHMTLIINTTKLIEI